DKQSILIWKKKTHYNEWEFVYDPLTDMVQIGNNVAGSPLPQTPPGSSPTPPSPQPGPPVNPQN
ncbi:MAG: hypothetical protein WCE75_05975, partial [Terracidiphilus sp.]